MVRSYWAVSIVGLSFSLLAGGALGLNWALSVLVGAAVALGNLFLLAHSLRRMLAGGGISGAGLAFLKFLGLLAITYVLISTGLVEPLALAIGFGALPFGILAAGLGGASSASDLPPGRETDHA